MASSSNELKKSKTLSDSLSTVIPSPILAMNCWIFLLLFLITSTTWSSVHAIASTPVSGHYGRRNSWFVELLHVHKYPKPVGFYDPHLRYLWPSDPTKVNQNNKDQQQKDQSHPNLTPDQQDSGSRKQVRALSDMNRPSNGNQFAGDVVPSNFQTNQLPPPYPSISPPVRPHQLQQSSPRPGFSLHDELALCHQLSGLSRHQRFICKQHSGLIWATLEGTQLGLHECIHQFRFEKWNCSVVNLLYDRPTGVERRNNLLTRRQMVPKVHGLEGVLQRASREAAFLSATWAAGVVQAITRACSGGLMSTCDCDPHRREGEASDTEGLFTWGGCSDPIKFGMRMTRLFLDTTDQEHRRLAMARERQLEGGANALLYRGRRGGRRAKRFPRSLSMTNQTTSTRPRSSSSIGAVQAELLRLAQTKARVYMNLHNRNAGRRMVWKNRIRKCKCHGVSGACSMRTCWQRVNDFRQIGQLLKSAYDKAEMVAYEPRLDSLKSLSASTQASSPIWTSSSTSIDPWLSQNQWDYRRSGRWKRDLSDKSNSRYSRSNYPSQMTSIHRYSRQARISKNNLVYLEESHNFCDHDESIGHYGIAGRVCNASTVDQPNSCNKLCCDRGYDTVEHVTRRKCDCKFFWCCEVRCKICQEKTTVFQCKQ